MTLSIRFGYLSDFNRLLSSDDYLQEALTKKSSMVYKIDKDANTAYIKKVLTNRNINFVIT
jgi:hypothetical protein